FDLVDHLPQILADLTAQAVAALAVEAEAPQLPQAVGIDFGSSARRFDEGVIRGDAVAAAADATWLVIAARLANIIDVDAQHLGKDAGQILADVELVGDARAVASDDVEHAVGAELEAAAVVAAVGPFDDDLL